MLVSCICPTTAGRSGFLEKAKQYFESQAYAKRELIVVEGDGLVGDKRNEAIARSRGDVIMHWDDDDWYHPMRIEDQVRHLRASSAALIASSTCRFARDADRRAWRYSGSPVGVTFCYRRSLCDQVRFRHATELGQLLPWGEDNQFWRDARTLRQAEFVDTDAVVARIHGGNTCRKDDDKLGMSAWTEISFASVLESGYDVLA